MSAWSGIQHKGNIHSSMAVALNRESFFWHRVHSLTGIVPVGFYVVQHLTLNSFAIISPAKFNGVSEFFYSLPTHILLALEIGVILIPLIFHAVYGLFITARGEPNYLGTTYNFPQNRMYWLQRVSGIFLFIFLLFHVITTTGKVKLAGGDHTLVDYGNMQHEFTRWGYVILVLYALGVLAAAYHLCYGLWNFGIRWGLTISEAAQEKIRKTSFVLFILITALGWAALGGFLMHRAPVESHSVQAPAVRPLI